MPTVERRLEQLEGRLPSRRLRDVRDVTELSSVELSLHILDFLPSTYQEALESPNLSFLKDRLNRDWICDDSLSDPLERYVAYLLRTVIWGHHNEALDGPTREAAPMLAEEFRGRFPDRVFVVAEKAPPWPRVAVKKRLLDGDKLTLDPAGTV
jgi:hypothetical protein